jgi:glucose-1-phosphate cytidylyltransferase
MSDVTFDMAANSMTVHEAKAEPWRVALVNTREDSMTGGRLKRVRDFVGDDEFCFTYGDGVADIDITKLATITATQPPGRFGAIDLNGSSVNRFIEKPRGDGNWINGGFFVLSPKVIDYVKDDATIWENEPLERLAAENQLSAFLHAGFWHPMDTLRDKLYLEDLWSRGKAPWKVW